MYPYAYRYPILQSFVRRCILSFFLVWNLNLVQLAVSNDDLFTTTDLLGDDNTGGSTDFPNNLDWPVPLGDQFTGNNLMMTDENNLFNNDLLLADNLSIDVDDGQSCRLQQPVKSKKFKVREPAGESCSSSDDAPNLSLSPFRSFSATQVASAQAQDYWCWDSPMTYGEVPVCSVDLSPVFDYYKSLVATLSQFDFFFLLLIFNEREKRRRTVLTYLFT